MSNNERKRKPRLSISRINTLSRCGEQYRRRYIDEDIIAPGIAQIVGLAIDKSSETNLRSKMEGKGLMPLDAVADAARDAFNARWAEGGVSLLPDEMAVGLKTVKGKALDKSVRLSRLHATTFAPAINPTHLQRRLDVEIEGCDYDLTGYVDYPGGGEGDPRYEELVENPGG